MLERLGWETQTPTKRIPELEVRKQRLDSMVWMKKRVSHAKRSTHLPYFAADGIYWSKSPDILSQDTPYA